MQFAGRALELLYAELVYVSPWLMKLCKPWELSGSEYQAKGAGCRVIYLEVTSSPQFVSVG
jgi:hypothetical protein